MYSSGSKKMLNIYILEILRRHTDADHQLSQQQIIDYLQKDFGVECERKAVSRNINYLSEYKYDIRTKGGYYLAEREFDTSELHMLITSVLFAKNIPHNQREDLIEKLKGLASEYFSYSTSSIRTQQIPRGVATENKQMFYTIEIIHEAISKCSQVKFTYNAYGTDKQLHSRRAEPYIASPYSMVAANGRFYLVCHSPRHEGLSSYRIDRITDIELVDTPAIPITSLPGYENGYSGPHHMAEGLYMHMQQPVSVEFRIKKANVNDVLDWFDGDCTFRNETDEYVDVRVTANEQAVLYWALQYGKVVAILKPDSLRKKIRQTALEVYNKHQ